MRSLLPFLALAAGAAAVAAVLLFAVDRRTDEEKVRDACRELLEACLARDLEAVWDLQAGAFRERVHGVFDAIRSGEGVYEVDSFTEITLRPDPEGEAWEGLDDEELFVRETREYLEEPGPGSAEEPNGWAPWVLPGELLRDVSVEKVTFEEGEAKVELRFGQTERGSMRLSPAEFFLVPEDGDWRFDRYAFQWREPHPPEPYPPDHEVGVAESGAPKLTVTLRGEKYPPDLRKLLSELKGDPASATVVLRPDVELPWRSVARVLLQAVEEGVRSFEVLPWGRPPEERICFAIIESVYSIDTGLAFRTVGGTMRFDLPGEDLDPSEVDVIVQPGRGTSIDLRLQQWMAWLAEWDPDLVVLFDPHPDLTCGRVSSIFDFVERPGVERVLLTTPPEDTYPVPEGVLVNGRPLESLPHPPRRKPGELLPPRSGLHPVPEGHDALERVLR